MKIKTERFWSEEIKDIIKDINDSYKRMEIEPIHSRLDDLFEIFKKSDDFKLRVSLCFVFEKIAQFEPFYDKIIDFLILSLETEENPHVKEFSVYILGNCVINKPNLALITRTLPIFVKFCKDSSQHVRTCAEEMKDRLHKVKETKMKEQEVIIQLLQSLGDFIDERITSMNDRASEISKQALSLDYEAAFNLQEEMVEKIHEFSESNEHAEADIKTFIRNQTKENPVFEGEFKGELDRWKNVRAEKEDLIRQVHCIIRIQGKIFRIIEFVKYKGESESLSIDELKKQTEGGLRGEWSDKEIIDTLEKLVEEEIIPNLFLQQVKDLKGIMEDSKKKKDD